MENVYNAPKSAWNARCEPVIPSANISIVTGQISNITVIDCDDKKLSVNDLENEFGNSDFIVKTPNGGYHLYYKYK